MPCLGTGREGAVVVNVHDNRVSCSGVTISGMALRTYSWDNLLKMWGQELRYIGNHITQSLPYSMLFIFIRSTLITQLHPPSNVYKTQLSFCSKMIWYLLSL
ncbi:hypothetical protein BD408DRAFT_13373, partial [Parasitella parasitica]